MAVGGGGAPAPAITWAFVRTIPFGPSMTTPDPPKVESPGLAMMLTTEGPTFAAGGG
jgi:hypothetical protein